MQIHSQASSMVEATWWPEAAFVVEKWRFVHCKKDLKEGILSLSFTVDSVCLEPVSSNSRTMTQSTAPSYKGTI